MKKIFYSILALSIIFSACKKEEETNNNSPSIVGSWEINTFDLYSDTSNYTYTAEVMGFFTNLEFLEGGELIETWGQGLDTNEWVIIADSVYIGEDGEDFIAKYEITNTSLTLTGPFDDGMLDVNTMRINATRE